MKRHAWLSYLILFSIFFPIGFWTGSQISPQNQTNGFLVKFKMISSNAAEINYPSLSSISQSNSYKSKTELSQTNLLILFIDDLNAPQPKLTSAWLLIHPDDSARLIFLPIFQEDTAPEDLLSSFQLDGKRLSKRFVHAIEKRKLLWHGFIVIDRQAQAQIAEKVKPSLSPEALASFAILNAVCQSLPNQPQTLVEIKRLIPAHLMANFDLESSLALWQLRLSSHPYLQCEFPTTSP
jgi:hypothetical protein